MNERFRQFDCYESVDDFLNDNKQNSDSYEIMHREFKLHFDIEYLNHHADFINDMIKSTATDCNKFLKH